MGESSRPASTSAKNLVKELLEQGLDLGGLDLDPGVVVNPPVIELLQPL